MACTRVWNNFCSGTSGSVHVWPVRSTSVFQLLPDQHDHCFGIRLFWLPAELRPSRAWLHWSDIWVKTTLMANCILARSWTIVAVGTSPKANKNVSRLWPTRPRAYLSSENEQSRRFSFPMHASRSPSCLPSLLPDPCPIRVPQTWGHRFLRALPPPLSAFPHQGCFAMVL